MNSTHSRPHGQRACHQLASCIAALALSACATRSNLDTNTTDSPASSGDAIVVLGVKPDWRLGFLRSTYEGGVFHDSKLVTATALVYPSDGYIILRVPPTEATQRYAISSITTGEGFLKRRLYAPCDGGAALTFDAPAGKVIYLGDLEYRLESGRVVSSATFNFEAAQRFVDGHYPALNGQLVPGRIEPRPVADMPCQTGAMTIPIFIPAQR